MTDAPDRITAYNEAGRGYSFTTFGVQPHFGPVEYIRADIVESNAKAHKKEIAVWTENYAALERKLALAYHRAAEEADPWCGPPVKSNIVNAQSIAAQQIKARILALAHASATLEQTPIKP